MIYHAQPFRMRSFALYRIGCNFNVICDLAAQSQDEICRSEFPFKVQTQFHIISTLNFPTIRNQIISNANFEIAIIFLKNHSQIGESYVQKRCNPCFSIYWLPIFAFDGHRASIERLLFSPGLKFFGEKIRHLCCVCLLNQIILLTFASR